MSKKDYIDAMNEIEPRESLKKETFAKITEKTKKYNRLYPILSLATMLIIAIGIGVPLYNNKDIEKVNEKMEVGKAESVPENSAEEKVLPRVENFENLYEMINNMEEYEKYYSIDVALENTDATIKADTNATNNTERKEYSQTNTQVQGVDEADIVKTDGNYIYYMTGNEIIITNVENENIKVMSKIDFKNDEINPNELYIRNDKLIVIGRKNVNEKGSEFKKIEEKQRIAGRYTYYTVIQVYDIGNKEKPEISRTVETEGSYLSSRMIGDNIYLMSNKYIYSYLCRNYEIDELNEDVFKPQYLDTVVSDEVKCIDFSEICYIPETDTANYLNIVSFNVTNNEPANIESYLGAGTEVYSSAENLYVAKIKYDYKEDNFNKHTVTTEIYKFNLENGKCKLVNTGKVPGAVLNQFSMDEDGENFRIATTDSKSWSDKDNTNNLYVLDKELNVIGKVEGLAKGEKIYSVRFMGNRAYMVTFVQTDPLFVIDLSEPTNPTVLGELKIPGYSKYLHPYDETHIIGFGENTKVVNYGYGERVITDGMKMALFDVTDPNNPKEMYSIDIGEKGTSSELLYNHKALLFSKEKNIIAFPISITEEEYNENFQGAIVYGLTLENGFEEKGKISHMEDDYDRYHSKNRVERILYINDKLFTLSEGMIKSTDMNTMKEINHIDL